MRSLKIILFAILLVSCEEYFNPDTDATEPIYVFEGLVTDQPGPYKVKVSKSYGYNGKIETVTDANVRIECSDGHTYVLECDSTGSYISDSSNFIGEVGKFYKLVVILPDGQHFESTREKLLPCPEIEEVNGLYYETKEIVSNGSTYFDDVETGICATNTTATAGFTPYYRYSCKIVIQTRQHYPGTFPVDRYVYRPLIPEGILLIADANNYTDKKIIGNQLYKTSRKMMLIGVDSLVEDASNYEIYNYGVFVLVKQLSMDENQYKYWKAVKNQQENTNYLFGQVENQPIGNISNKSGEKALGYFCVSAVKQNFGALGLKESRKSVSKYYANSFPDTDTIAYYELPQDFTIFFDN